MRIGCDGVEAISRGVDRQRMIETITKFLVGQFGEQTYVTARLGSLVLAWAGCGLPVLEPRHQLAASLMATSVSEDAISDLRLPWRCFGIEIASGLIGDGRQFVLVHQRPDGGEVTAVRFADGIGEHGMIEWGTEPSIADWGGHDRFTRVDGNGDVVILDEDVADFNRQSIVFGRLLVGLCIEMEAVNSGSSRCVRSARGRWKRGQPKAWTWKLTRPVRVDARAAIRDFVSGNAKSAPSVQSLVRGHWKLQPCGKDQSQRRRIHVEPYWRGPEDAPIAVRHHVIREAAVSP